MRLAVPGLTMDLPPGWEARAKTQPPSRPGRRGNLLLHAATIPIPSTRGDFGSGVVDLLRADDVFVSLFEYDPEDAKTALFAAKGLPTVRPADFSTGVMQRTIKGRSGAQWFFSAAGRAFTLHVVLGSHGRRAPGAVRLQALLDGTTIGKL
ncbi:MAG: hypothetical protein Q8R60_06600 [Mycobacteriales bacterium]|nr:hypothetical protein [Mycobacteriales bacterium]